MHSIRVYKNENIDRALKRLKIQLDVEGTMETIKAKRYFETEAQKKKRKQKAQDRKYKRGR
jgi:ribosomal protein S21